MSEADAIARSRAIIQNHYDFTNEGDWSKIEAQFADDVVLEEAEGHPCPGVWRGKEALREGGAGVVSSLGLTKVTVVELMGSASRVAALIEVTMTDPAGTSFTHEVIELWRLDEEAKITEIRPFYHDLVAVRRRLGLD
jgi:ketosteroid isomerase-like protein